MVSWVHSGATLETIPEIPIFKIVSLGSNLVLLGLTGQLRVGSLVHQGRLGVNLLAYQCLSCCRLVSELQGGLSGACFGGLALTRAAWWQISVSHTSYYSKSCKMIFESYKIVFMFYSLYSMPSIPSCAMQSWSRQVLEH